MKLKRVLALVLAASVSWNMSIPVLANEIESETNIEVQTETEEVQNPETESTTEESTAESELQEVSELQETQSETETEIETESAKNEEVLESETKDIPAETEKESEASSSEAEIENSESIHMTILDDVIDSGQCGTDVSWEIDASGKIVIYGTGDMEDYEWNNRPWEDFKDFIIEVEIREGVTSIGAIAFSNCSSLEIVELPEGLTSIGAFAFYECGNLESIEIPTGVTSIGCGTFSYCSSLESIEIPETVTSIESGVFLYCSSLKSIEIPTGVTSIRENAFYCCFSLTSIKIPASVTRIEANTFLDCSSLESIEIPETVTSIESNVFSGCSSLKSIEIPTGVTSIGYGTFSDCSSLESVEIPAGVTSIGESTFENCSSLESIKIPLGVTSIGTRAFDDCSSLESIEIPETVTSIESNVFYNCSSLKSIEIPTGVTSIGDYAFSGCSSLKSIEIPTGVTSIGYGTFSNCSSLKSVEIPAGVTSIGESTFENCSSLESIKIPLGVTSIGTRAFDDCSSLESIEIPETVTSIESNVFYNCSSLKSIEIPTGVTSIGDYAFSGCSSLESIEIPKGAISIGARAFSNCNNLTIYIADVYCDFCKRVELGNGWSGYAKVIARKGEGHTWGEGEIDSESRKVKYTCNECGVYWGFSYSESEDGIYINRVMEKERCDNVRIPRTIAGKNVIHISMDTFKNCPGLERIEIPDTVNYIGDRAFEYCYNLTDVVMPENTPFIGYDAFYGTPVAAQYNTVFDYIYMVGDGHGFNPNMYEVSIVKGEQNAEVDDHSIKITGLGEIVVKIREKNNQNEYTRILNITSDDKPYPEYLIPATIKVGHKIDSMYLYHNCLLNPEMKSYGSSSGMMYQDLLHNIDYYFSQLTIDQRSKCLSVVCNWGDDYPINPETRTVNGWYLSIATRPGTFVVAARRDENSEQPYVVTVEKPIIESNLPEEIALGTELEVKSMLTNTEFENMAIDEAKNRLISIGYEPVLEIISGEECIERTNGDYSNTLSTKENIKFIKTGTVEFKFIYNLFCEPRYYAGDAYYSPEKTFKVIVKSDAIQKYNISDCSVTLSSGNYTYDGTAKKPTVTVKRGNTKLVENTDYTVTYSSNTNAGTAKVTIQGKGSYAGTVNKNFTINKAEQALSASIAQSTIEEGKTSQITAKGQGTITYSSSNTSVAKVNASGLVTGVKEGNATITVTASGNSNYKGASKTLTVAVKQPDTPVGEFVTRLYGVCLDRTPDESGKSDWSTQLTSGNITGVQAAYGFIFSDEFKSKNLCNEDYVEYLYLAFMGRNSDPSGKAGWLKQLRNGNTREEVFNGFALSKEFYDLCKQYGIEQGNGIDIPKYGTVPTGNCSMCGKEDDVTSFVKRLYKVCLDRNPDKAGLDSWVNTLRNHTASGSSVAYGFMFSNEFINKNYSDEDYVEHLYQAFMGRGSDPVGKSSWVNGLKNGWSRKQVFDGFVGSQEFTHICNSYGILRD